MKSIINVSTNDGMMSFAQLLYPVLLGNDENSVVRIIGAGEPPVPDPITIEITALRSGINGSYYGADVNYIDFISEDLANMATSILFKGSNGEDWVEIKDSLSSGYNVLTYYYPGTVSTSEAPFQFKVILPGTTTALPASAFYAATAITSVTIPEGIETINNNVFGMCYPGASQSSYPYTLGLQTVTLPNSVKSVGTFGRCAVNTVYYNGVAYTTKDALTSALTANGVTVATNAFSNTDLG